jgi:hypothetical protein
MLDALNLSSNDDAQNGTQNGAMDIELRRGDGSPLRMSITLYVLIQIVMGAFLFGGLYASLKSDLERTSIRMSESEKRQEEMISFQKDAIRQLAILQTELSNVRDELRFLRTQKPQP